MSRAVLSTLGHEFVKQQRSSIRRLGNAFQAGIEQLVRIGFQFGIRAALCHQFLQIFQAILLVGQCDIVACPTHLIEQANRHCIDFVDRDRRDLAGYSTELFCICNQFCPLWIAQHLSRFGETIQHSLVISIRRQLHRLCYQSVGIERGVFVLTRQNPLPLS